MLDPLSSSFYHFAEWWHSQRKEVCSVVYQQSMKCINRSCKTDLAKSSLRALLSPFWLQLQVCCNIGATYTNTWQRRILQQVVLSHVLKHYLHEIISLKHFKPTWFLTARNISSHFLMQDFFGMCNGAWQQMKNLACLVVWLGVEH